MLNNYLTLLKREFQGYSRQKLIKDMMAGLTVAAVALPLALAFGVSSGANGAAGLMTAIIAGLMIGALSGASYQISGPTGAMSAILIGLSQSYGLQGVFIASFLSGIILLIASIFKFGKLVSFIPSSVITGFTSGIAILIFFQQINNFFGVTSSGSSTIDKFLSYFDGRFVVNLEAMIMGLLVIVFMLIYPKKWSQYCPSSLAAIILALIAHLICHFNVGVVGEIPSTLFLADRLDVTAISMQQVSQFIVPAFSIAALGMIESLLCGASAGKMKNEPIDADQELLAQGIGNMVIPFFGGVPATAAIARTSVAIKAGGQTRLVSIFHAVTLLLAMFILGPWMAQIPLSALAGVLMVTAWRMNEWDEIKAMFKHRVKTPILQFTLTMVATVVFDLTIAIVVGVLSAMIMFVLNNSSLHIDMSDVEVERMKNLYHHHKKTKVIYLSGPLFFANQGQLKESFQAIVEDSEAIVLSMRGVSFIDDSGIHEMEDIYQLCKDHQVVLLLSGVQTSVKKQMSRVSLDQMIGQENFYWDAIGAIYHLDTILQ